MRSTLTWRVAALAAAFALIGCGGPADDGPPAGTPDTADTADAAGQASLSLTLPNASMISRVDYRVTISFLESDPPQVTLVEEYSVVQYGGELTAILPCTTLPTGTGMNQVEIEADVFFRNRDEPVRVGAIALFECVRNSDTLVNIVLNLVQALDAGFVDIDVAASGTLCAGKVDYKGDGYLGVCADASCGDSESVFLFANTCQAVSGNEPIYWVCGTATDWTLSGSLATSRFPVPDTDGTWSFGLIALDPLHMVQTDLSLTDEEGYLKVWAGVARTVATLTREGGENHAEDPVTEVRDFGAEIQVPPQAPGQPSPTLLLTVHNDDDGAHVRFQRAFGPCDQEPEGLSFYDDYVVRDVRRDGPNRLRLLMTDRQVTWLNTVAECEGRWTEAGAPGLVCGIPGSVLP